MTAPPNPFDRLAETYDRWFESDTGRPIFELEVACLKSLIGTMAGRWLEVGVGAGRFAQALGITAGLEPSAAMVALAKQRGIEVVRGVAEQLPYKNASFDGLLLVVTICFVADPVLAMCEASRVLKDNGALVVGLVPSTSAWGQKYLQQGKEGHPFYSAARFYTSAQVTAMARQAGLSLQSARSCLLVPPGQPIDKDDTRDGIDERAGFVAMRFVRALLQP